MIIEAGLAEVDTLERIKTDPKVKVVIDSSECTHDALYKDGRVVPNGVFKANINGINFTLTRGLNEVPLFVSDFIDSFRADRETATEASSKYLIAFDNFGNPLQANGY